LLCCEIGKLCIFHFLMIRVFNWDMSYDKTQIFMSCAFLRFDLYRNSNG